MDEVERPLLTTKELYIKYLKGEATFEEVEASVEPTWNYAIAKIAQRRTEAAKKQAQ